VPPAQRPALFNNLCAAAESGWDFSSRWFADRANLSTVATMSVLPVELNSLLLRVEETLSALHAQAGDGEAAQRYQAAAVQRAALINAVFWNDSLDQWVDVVYDGGAQVEICAGCAGVSRGPPHVVSNFLPLFAELAPPQPKNVSHVAAALLASGLLGPGGLCTTGPEFRTGQQWDFPYAWAPLVHMVVEGLNATGGVAERALALGAARTFVQSALAAFNATGLMYEKYDCSVAGQPGGGGEYTVQTGFGWTNGVVLSLLWQYGDLLA
jgi:alpha,alpha-trehalase